jgi:hypothetical protein
MVARALMVDALQPSLGAELRAGHAAVWLERSVRHTLARSQAADARSAAGLGGRRGRP